MRCLKHARALLETYTYIHVRYVCYETCALRGGRVRRGHDERRGVAVDRALGHELSGNRLGLGGRPIAFGGKVLPKLVELDDLVSFFRVLQFNLEVFLASVGARTNVLADCTPGLISSRDDARRRLQRALPQRHSTRRFHTS